MFEPILIQSRNIYGQQAHNRRMTWCIITAVVVLLTILGFGFDYFYLGLFQERIDIPPVTCIAFVVSIVVAIGGLQGGATVVLQSAQATPANPANPDHRQLLNVVQEMSLASGIPVPPVYIIPDDDPNAFATGKDPQHSFIAVTRGLLSSLDREELQGVIAHEMSHIRNYDIRLMTIVAAFVGAIVLLADLTMRGMRFGLFSRGSRSKGRGALGAALLVLWLITALLAPLIAQLMAMMISRKREYLADASAGELTRNPVGLAKALQKIENAVAPTASIKRGVAHLCIVDPLGKKVNEKEGFWAELFATHPPIQKRIMLLKSMAYQRG